MTHSKKHISSWRCGAFDICLGFLIIFYPLILLNSFLTAFLFLFFLSTISSLNTISMVKKTPSFSILMQLSSYDERVTDKLNSRKTEKKVFKVLSTNVFKFITGSTPRFRGKRKRHVWENECGAQMNGTDVADAPSFRTDVLHLRIDVWWHFDWRFFNPLPNQ